MNLFKSIRFYLISGPFLREYYILPLSKSLLTVVHHTNANDDDDDNTTADILIEITQLNTFDCTIKRQLSLNTINRTVSYTSNLPNFESQCTQNREKAALTLPHNQY